MPKASNPLLRSLGRRIRALRDDQGLSQEALADAAGIDRSYMSGIERGVRNVGVNHLAKVAKALDIPLASLFERL